MVGQRSVAALAAGVRGPWDAPTKTGQLGEQQPGLTFAHSEVYYNLSKLSSGPFCTAISGQS